MIERWDPEIHLALLASWFGARGHAETAGDARLYPSTGFVVDRCAVGFVYATNAPLVGYLDGFVTDPAAPVRRRYRALQRLLAALEEEAAALGITSLLASTNVRGLMVLGARAGFAVYGHGFAYMAKARK